MKQVLGISYKQREIVLVPFPYSDLSTIKKRPVLIVSNNHYNKQNEDVLVCVITSNQYKDHYSVDIENNNLEVGILPESSIVKVHKLFTIHKTKIIKKFSTVKLDYYNKIEKILIELIHLQQKKKTTPKLPNVSLGVVLLSLLFYFFTNLVL